MMTDAPEHLVWVEGWQTWGKPYVDGRPVPGAGPMVVAPGPYDPIALTETTVEVEMRGKGQRQHTQTFMLDRAAVTVYVKERGEA